MSERMYTRLFPAGLKFTAALLMVVRLFLLGVVLTPSVPAAQLVNDQLVYVRPVEAQALQPKPFVSDPVNGTLASFTALIPDILSVYIPSVLK